MHDLACQNMDIDLKR